jgi:hypothetical protein
MLKDWQHLLQDLVVHKLQIYVMKQLFSLPDTIKEKFKCLTFKFHLKELLEGFKEKDLYLWNKRRQYLIMNVVTLLFHGF